MNKKIARIGALAAGGALAMGLAVAAATPASAIERLACTSDDLNLVSSSTTCWGYAGTTNVKLYGVYSIHSGNNAGRVQGSKSTYYFDKYSDQGIPSQTITVIKID